MAKATFEERIEKKLKGLNREQIVRFAWICAVRALPFLAVDGNFNYWKEKDRQNHLYSILYALDSNAARAARAAYDAYTAAVDAGAAATTYAIDAGAATTYAAAYDAAYDAAYAAAYAAAAAYDAYAATYDAAYDAYDAATYDAYAATYDAAYSAVATYDAYDAGDNTGIRNIFLDDIDSVKSGDRLKAHFEIYGKVWDNFQQALKNEKCEYWGKLYQEIFETGLVNDPKKLKMRVTIPEEIRAKGAAAVGNYLENLEKDARRLDESRIIILGEKGAGKTCLARRLEDINAPMTEENESTQGVDTIIWKPEKEDLNIRIWDFAGHVITHAVHQCFLSERSLYIIVYDGRSEERNRLNYWLDHVKNYGGDSKVYILVNKQDDHSVRIHINNLKEKYKNIVALYNFSIGEDKEDLAEFRKTIVNFIKTNPLWNKQQIPGSYYDVKEALEELFLNSNLEKREEYITEERFDKIVEKYHGEESVQLLDDLHSLGISLWYREMEQYKILILNPEWISHGIYKIINWVHENKKHSLHKRDLDIVFFDERKRFPKEKDDLLLDLMLHYKLAYRIKNNGKLIIPYLLEVDQPETLPHFEVEESLKVKYKSESSLPPDTISRFIVIHNEEIYENTVWRYGVILRIKGAEALVREEGRSISVSVKGNKKKQYLSQLRKTLNDIFNTYKSEKPKLEYRIETYGLIPAERTIMLPGSKILNHFRDNMPYYDDETRVHVDLNLTMNNYDIKIENSVLGGQGNQIVGGDSITNNFNFHNCNIDLQSNLNDLAASLMDKSREDAEELQTAAKMLQSVEMCQKPEEVKGSGIRNRLKRIINEMADENSALHKTVKGIKYGVSLAQDVAKSYNDIAQWVGWPQVPGPFLRNE